MRATFLLLLAILAGAGTAAAQEERAIDNFAGVGVRAMGMGGAYVGVADDFTAVYWNPAGLAQIRHREVHVAFLRNSRTNGATLAGTRASSELSNTRFGSLGGVFPYPVYRGSLVFAAGFNRVKDFDWSLRMQGIEQELEADHFFHHEGELSLAAVAGAMDVSPSISLGLTVGLLSGEDQAVNEFNWTDSLNRFEEKRFLARDTFEDDYESAFHATLGAMIRTPREKSRFRLGATISTGATHEISYTFRGILDESGYSQIEYDDGTVRENVAVEADGTLREVPDEIVKGSYKLSLPLEFGLGASLAPIKGLVLAGSVHFAEWSQSEYEGNDVNQLRTHTVFEPQYEDVVRYHLGMEWQVPTIALDLRAGFFTDPLPFVGPRDPNRLPHPVENPPILFEQDRRFFTLGAGLLVDQVVQVDVAWVRGSFEQAEGDLTEDNTINRLFGGVGYRF